MANVSDLVASTVMNQAAALLNDPAKTNYTFAVQIPYLNMALQELQELFELNDIPVTQETSASIPIDAGVTEVGYAPTPPIGGVSYLPNDLIEPSILWERARNINPYIMMTKQDYLPKYEQGAEINQVVWWVWETQKLKFLAANADNDILINYVRSLFTAVTASTDTLNVVNAATFLEYRTAALCAEFIDQNTSRSSGLNNYAAVGLDRVTGIGTKGRQAIFTRRRPFRAGYKRLYYG